MEEIDKLYERLIVYNDNSPSSCNINSSVKTSIHKKILDDLDNLREKQGHLDSDSDDYRQLDRQIRLILLKEIQVVIDEYIMAKNNNDLKRWKAMYGDVETYKRNFFYYRLDVKYETDKKILTDYRFA